MASVRLAPAALELILFERGTLEAQALDAGGAPLAARPIRWSSSDPEVASVDAAGAVHAVGLGQATIRAEAEGRAAEATVTVRAATVQGVTVEPSVARVVEGEVLPLVATVVDERGRPLLDRPVRWESDAPDAAEVDEAGRVRGLRRGATVTVTASVEGHEARATVEVLPPVVFVGVEPERAHLLVGQTLRLRAIAKDNLLQLVEGRPVRWWSSDEAIATVDDSGQVAAMGAGLATIEAEVEGRRGFAVVEVAPAADTVEAAVEPAELRVGGVARLAAVVRDAAGGRLEGLDLRWTSSDPAVVDVVGGSTLEATGVGAATVTVEVVGHGVQASAPVQVRPAAELVVDAPHEPLLLAGSTYQLGLMLREPEGGLVPPRAPRWTSVDESVARVDDEGRVRIVGVGRATVIVEAEGLRYALDRLAVGRFVDLALGRDVTCGLASNGTAWCWGRLARPVAGGMRLVGETIPRFAAEGLVAIRAGAGRCAYVPALGVETCDLMFGLTEAGEIVGWVPGLPPTPVADAGFVDFAATEPLCGVTSTGAVLCGDEPVLLEEAARIWATELGGCALLASGAAACEGTGAFAQDLGGLAFAPDAPGFPISISSTHGCGLAASGDALCWGANAAGQIQAPGEPAAWLPPTAVMAGARSVAAATDVTLVVDQEGTLHRLGGEEYVVKCAPNEPVPEWLVEVDEGATEFSEQGEVTSVHVGPDRHRCLLLRDGRPLCWGVSDAGETGSVPRKVQVCGAAPVPTRSPTGIYPER